MKPQFLSIGSMGLVGRAVPSVSEFLDGIIASTCCDMDATIAASFTSGQTWKNLTSNPNDGSAKTGYDHFLGANIGSDSADPTFTGSAGDPAAFFALDGGDYFTIPEEDDAITINKAATAGAKGWFAIAYKTDGTGFDSNFSLFGSTTGSLRGFSIKTIFSRSIALGYGTGLSGRSITLAGGVQFPVNTDFLTIVSFDVTTTTDNVRMWHNNRTKVVKSEDMSPQALGQGATGHIIGGSWDGVGASKILPSGTRIYGFYMGDDFIDDAEAALIYDHINARHDRVYA